YHCPRVRMAEYAGILLETRRERRYGAHFQVGLPVRGIVFHNAVLSCQVLLQAVHRLHALIGGSRARHYGPRLAVYEYPALVALLPAEFLPAVEIPPQEPLAVPCILVK